MQREARHAAPAGSPFSLEKVSLHGAAHRVMRHPAVADKTFLVSIGDRTVGGLCARDPCVGPWQVPVADCAVALLDYDGYAGEAFAIGERAPLALLDGPASGRMAVGEAITNLAAARIASLGSVKLSANWMAAAGYPGEDAALYDTVRAVALELCPALGISIPVGKDSLSMRTAWDGKEVVAPLSLIVSAFAPVEDARGTLTPQLRGDAGDTELVLVDLGRGKNRLGGSILAQVHAALGDACPDLDDPALLKSFFAALQELAPLVLAYHDRSDGGLFATVCEMSFAGHCGVTLNMDSISFDPATDDVDAFKRGDDEQLAGRAKDLGLSVHLTFQEKDIAPATGVRPRIAILREQGVNGHVEMAAAFDRAGFEAVDVHMTDLIAGRASLAGFKGFAAGGGFSYGDVLGAGRGWANTILFNSRVRTEFEQFFARRDTFALGACNGCQMMAALKELIPGAEHWPAFVRNRSEQFEGRLVMVEITPSPSLFFDGMAGSRMPIVTAHGEGRAEYPGNLVQETWVAMRYVDNRGHVTETYPYNPSGSPRGITGLTTPDGRFTIVMPHPERVFRNVQFSWCPDRSAEDSPWMRIFRNARKWVQ